jgi:MoaA/NifB/PqqE/SkfB family radical SAM enzyme
MNPFVSHKILKHLDRILEWQKKGVSHPITYELDMTNICNSKCPFCFGFYDREKDNSSLTLYDAKDIILQIKNFGGKGIIFTGGGEPLCNPETIKAVEYAKSLGLDVGFITNGLLLDKDTAKILVKNCTWIRISLDAGSDKTYKITHGLNSNHYKKVLLNIENLVKTKKELNSNVTIGTGFLTFPEVISDMESFVLQSKDLGVDYAQFRPLLKNFFKKEINFSPNKEILEKIKFCKTKSRKNFKVVSSEHKYERMLNGKVQRLYKKCFGHNFATVISANKKMYLCCHTRGIEKYCIGDLNKDSLETIWFSEERKQVYENINFKDCPLLCRCDTINEILWNITQESVHVNFL